MRSTANRGDLAASLVRELPNYSIVDRDGAYPTGAPKPVGDGGSSIVFRAIYRDRLHRAVKLIIPRDDLRNRIGSELFVNNFDTEVETLGSLSHENVVKITDFGVLNNDGQEYPFIVTDFIAGLPLDKFCRLPGTTGADILSVLHQTLGGIAYLHANEVLHCDIKPANIMVTSAAPPTAILLDLGVSHRIRPPEPEQTDDYTYYFSSEKYVPAALRTISANRHRPQIHRDELAKQFPWLDLHAFGVVLDELLADPGVKAKLVAARASLDALTAIRRRLDNPHRGTAHYQSALAVRNALARLPFHQISPLGLAELAPVPEKGVVLPTSRARVPGSHRVDAVISHPLFQRLHNLPQLDLLHHVLPGATHTRFVHALHTYDLARTAICHQLGDWRFRLGVEVSDIDATLFMALLDSVGRYHFQHMFEDFLRDRRQPDLLAAGLLNDSELLNEIMSENGSRNFDQIRDLRDGKGRRLCDVLTDCTQLDWADVRRRQTQPETAIQGFLAGLLSNPVDVDKLAYLIDDSAFSGLPFGHAVAPGPVFEAMRVPDDVHWQRLATPRVAVAVREKALSYVEQSVLSRYWNIQTGYWYRTNRSLQAMVKYQIGSLLKAKLLKFNEFILATLHLSADGALRWLDDKFREAIRAGDIDERTVDPMTGLLESRREIYKRLVAISPRSKLEERGQDRFIFERLSGKSALDDHEVCAKTAQVLEQVKPGLDVRPGEILLDLPRVRREEIGGKLLVYADGPGAALLGNLKTISPVLGGLVEQFDLYAKRLRIFIHPRLYAELDYLLDKAHEATLDMLRDEFPE